LDVVVGNGGKKISAAMGADRAEETGKTAPDPGGFLKRKSAFERLDVN
jgi:hypothetical protein